MIKLLLVLALSHSYSHDVELNSFKSMDECISSLVVINESSKHFNDSDLICLSVEAGELENPFK